MDAASSVAHCQSDALDRYVTLGSSQGGLRQLLLGNFSVAHPVMLITHARQPIAGRFAYPMALTTLCKRLRRVMT